MEGRIAKLASLAALIEDALQLLGIETAQLECRIGELRALVLVRTGLTEKDIQTAIAARADARKAKDFERADAIRETFSEKGINFQDLPEGTTWRPGTQL